MKPKDVEGRIADALAGSTRTGMVAVRQADLRTLRDQRDEWIGKHAIVVNSYNMACEAVEIAEQEVEQLRAMVAELADELDASVGAEYGMIAPDDMRPDQRRRYERDREPIRRARALISTEAPGHTDLMVSPESVSDYLDTEEAENA